MQIIQKFEEIVEIHITQIYILCIPSSKTLSELNIYIYYLQSTKTFMLQFKLVSIEKNKLCRENC